MSTAARPGEPQHGAGREIAGVDHQRDTRVALEGRRQTRPSFGQPPEGTFLPQVPDRPNARPGCGLPLKVTRRSDPSPMATQPPDQCSASPVGITPAGATMRIAVRTGARGRWTTPRGTV